MEKVRKIMSGKGLDGLIVTGRANTFYLSGFTGSTSYLLISMTKAWLVIDFRYTIQARSQVCEGIEVVEHDSTFLSTLDRIIADEGMESIGFEGNNLSYSEYERFKEKLPHAGRLESIGDEIDLLRVRKDDGEIEIIAEAVRLGDQVFDRVLKLVKPGIAELELAAEIEYQMRKLGAAGPSFATIVAAGERSAMCHAAASSNRIKPGDALILDFGVIYRNYCSDMTRTIFIGDPGEEMKRIYRIVRDAQLAALESLGSGMKARDADKVARDIITLEGYGACFGHSLGHGVGIEIHEEPRLSEKSEDILLDGMVFTVEPGIYVEGLGGVRIEDMVALVDGKPRNLTCSTKEMIIL